MVGTSHQTQICWHSSATLPAPALSILILPVGLHRLAPGIFFPCLYSIRIKPLLQSNPRFVDTLQTWAFCKHGPFAAKLKVAMALCPLIVTTTSLSINVVVWKASWSTECQISRGTLAGLIKALPFFANVANANSLILLWHVPWCVFLFSNG